MRRMRTPPVGAGAGRVRGDQRVVAVVVEVLVRVGWAATAAIRGMIGATATSRAGRAAGIWGRGFPFLPPHPPHGCYRSRLRHEHNSRPLR